MNSNTTILIKTDKKTKAAARRVVERAGIPLSTYLNMQLRKLASAENIELKLVPNAATARAIDAARKERKSDSQKGFDSMAALIADLHR